MTSLISNYYINKIVCPVQVFVLKKEVYATVV